ncbi:methylated-DNA-[protein]-cysteine S-methyltransferase [Varunaivibrio sulfuroxidans]|uniref:Methylated-DNA--protein-cysteine methyltransferase n=2 Tax=Varunaivibrio sulfuroxidans TaxID=1773489 RepID=A0A4R3JFE4_9PROT|nr:methylated-DNA-[protein]-cysteine S-methyltransferase [Varunaivibrio sulfuroxidans]
MAIVKTPMGDLSIFADAGAIVAIEYGRGATLSDSKSSQASPLLENARKQLGEYFLNRRQKFSLPLSPQGTPFQHQVWRIMQDIPFGETLTYGALAKRLSSSPRAVGGACRSNPIAIVIPCHRIVATAPRRKNIAQGFALGGYSGGSGPETKKRLLRLEQAVGFEYSTISDRATPV